MSTSESTSRTSSWHSSGSGPTPIDFFPACKHKIKAELCTSRTKAYPGRRYFRCASRKEDDCGFFEWVDYDPEERTRCPKRCHRIEQAYSKNYERWCRDKDDTIDKLQRENASQAAAIERANTRLEAAASTLEAYKKWAFFLSACVVVMFAYGLVAH